MASRRFNVDSIAGRTVSSFSTWIAVCRAGDRANVLQEGQHIDGVEFERYIGIPEGRQCFVEHMIRLLRGQVVPLCHERQSRSSHRRVDTRLHHLPEFRHARVTMVVEEMPGCIGARQAGRARILAGALEQAIALRRTEIAGSRSDIDPGVGILFIAGCPENLWQAVLLLRFGQLPRRQAADLGIRVLKCFQ